MSAQNLKRTLVLLALLLNVPSAHAQTPPDAGVLRQQIEQGGGGISHPLPVIPGKAAPAPLRELSGTTLTVKTFKFSGNTLVPSDVLQNAVAAYLNRSLDFSQLQDVATAVGNAYREAGWVVRAYLPQQEIEDGVVTIEIVEAVFGGARFEGQPSLRLSATLMQNYVDAAQKVGAPLHASSVDRLLLLLSDLPGVAVTGNLREGAVSGQTDLVFSVQDKSLLAGDASMDNTGSRSTGDQHISANLNLNNPWGRGDQLGANFMFSEGSAYGRVTYGLPFGYQGWHVGTNASYMSYRLVAPELKSLDANGSSATLGIEANYPIIRTRMKNLYLALNYEHKYFNNEANQATTTNYAVNEISAGLNSNLVDGMLGGGTNNFGLAWVHGTTDLNGSPNQIADALTSKVAGLFNKIRYSASRLQTVTETLAAYAAVTGQMADKNLDSSEKFYLGGASGVRAYPSNEGGGSDGQLLSIELRTSLPHGIALTGFYDRGHVSGYHDNGFAGAPVLNNFSLQGAGLAAGWSSVAGLNLKATWARRIGNNPNPTPSGNDQDGTLHPNRFWLQVSKQL